MSDLSFRRANRTNSNVKISQLQEIDQTQDGRQNGRPAQPSESACPIRPDEEFQASLANNITQFCGPKWPTSPVASQDKFNWEKPSAYNLNKPSEYDLLNKPLDEQRAFQRVLEEEEKQQSFPRRISRGNSRRFSQVNFAKLSKLSHSGFLLD